MLHQAILIVLGTAISPMLWMEQLWCKIGQIMSDRGGAYCCGMASMAAHCNVHHCHGNMEMCWWLQSLIVCLIEAMAVVNERTCSVWQPVLFLEIDWGWGGVGGIGKLLMLGGESRWVNLINLKTKLVWLGGIPP